MKVLQANALQAAQDPHAHAFGDGSYAMEVWGEAALRLQQWDTAQLAFSEALAHEHASIVAPLGLQVVAEVRHQDTMARAFAAPANRIWRHADAGALPRSARPHASAGGWAVTRCFAPLLLLLAVPLYVVGRALMTHQTLFYDDLTWIFYPWKESMYHSPFTLWNPWEFAGQPRFADVEQELYYPLNAVFAVVPTPTALALFVSVHLGMAAVFTCRWLRMLDASPPAACLGGLVFSLSSFVVLHTSQLTVLAQAAWLPAGLLTLERLRQRPCRREALVGALMARKR